MYVCIYDQRLQGSMHVHLRRLFKMLTLARVREEKISSSFITCRRLGEGFASNLFNRKSFTLMYNTFSEVVAMVKHLG